MIENEDKKPLIAISIGDLNGIGVEIALKAHEKISKYCYPIYCTNKQMLKQASEFLNMEIPKNFLIQNIKGEFEIKPGKVSKKVGNTLLIHFMKL